MRYIWKRCFAALLAVALVFTLLPATARAASAPFDNDGGTGQVGDPYKIATKAQFEAFRTYINTDDGHGEGQYFKLTEDIDLGDEEWVPIGNDSTYFKGVFDGAGHTVSGLHVVNTASYAKVGMFWYLDGTIKNLGVSGSVTGRNGKVGGIVGQNLKGTIENCHFTGTVNATEGGGSCQVGGIVGLNNGTISNCYFSGTAENNVAEVGGIAGKNQGTIENCYNTGTVTSSDYRAGGIAGSNIKHDGTCSVKNCYNTGKVSGGIAGGIVGYFSNNTTIENCYYLDSTADKGIGSGNSGGAKAKPADEFRSLADDLNSGSSAWEDGLLFGRPVLESNPEPVIATEDHPFEIPDKTTLENFRNYVNHFNRCKEMYFKVTANIDLGNEEWEPINYFYGTFDGGGYTISGLNINKQEESYIGLFQHLESDGTVKNLTVAGNVICESYGAGIVGDNKGTVGNCHNKCDISDNSSIYYYQGGVVGNNNGTVENCYNTGNISGNGGLGGIVGNNEGPVKNCYNTGNISGNSGAGGIVGSNGIDYVSHNVGTVENCYNSGEVTSSSAGGIVGSLSNGTIQNCYYLAGTVASGAGYGNSDGTTPKTETEFASGEVAWLLQEGQEEQNPQVWGQTVGSGYPELTDNIDKAVYKITGKVEDQESVVWYSNNKATLPTIEPTKEGFTFEGWTTVKSGPVNFDKDSPVSEDMTVYAVFTAIHQTLDGTGSVTMADYTCGDDSVKPVAVSSTNGTDHVTYYYKVRGAADSTYSTTKPSTAGEYTVKAVFAATDGYNEVTATADFKITHDYPDDWDGSSFECSCKRDLRLDVSYLTEVPEGLKNIEALDTVDEIRRILVEAVSTGANSAVYDIRLEVMDASGRWVEATDETFPTEGIHIVLPYPAGTDRGCTFTVVHMFASGSRAGETETPAVTNTAEGIAFTVTGLSPVCVGWTYPYPVYPGPAVPSTPHYGVTTPPVTSGGEVAVSPKSAQPGTKVTLTVTPEAGHHLGVLTVTDSAGRAVEVTDNGDGTYTFTMPYGQVNVSTSFVECRALAFDDLDTGAWYHGYVDYVLENGLMHGKGNNRFAPEGTVTRAEMVTTLWNLRGGPVVNYYMTYSDVNEESWYSEAVRWASSEGIAQGYGNGKFGPVDAITREQMAVMLYRYEKKYGSGGFTGAWMYLMPFDDLDSISDWAFEAVAWCNMRSIIEGKSGNVFDPKGLARRSELAAVLTRYDTAD